MTDRNRTQLGVLLIGHGTRDQAGLQEFSDVVAQVAKLLAPIPVESSFLELASPTIGEGIDRLQERSVQRMVVMPLLLFAAGHAKQDIPAAVHDGIQRHPEMTWRQAEHLGCHPKLLELSARRVEEAVPDTAGSQSGCQLIVVGRGSHDAEAIAETERYVALLKDQVGVATARLAFLAMAEPRLPQILAESAIMHDSTIVVQPHLLFHGELLEQVGQLVAQWRSQAPNKRWLVTRHLGPDELVVQVVLDRCEQIMESWNQEEAVSQ